jgi:hypothetical protein
MDKTTDIAVIAEIKTVLPKVSESYIKRAVSQGLTVQKAKESMDLSENFPVSVYHVIKLKKETDLSNNDLMNILEAWEETPVLTIRSLRDLYDVCDRDADVFEHVMSEYVLPYVIGDATKAWNVGVSSAMGRLTYRLRRHLDEGGSILDFEMK